MNKHRMMRTPEGRLRLVEVTYDGTRAIAWAEVDLETDQGVLGLRELVASLVQATLEPVLVEDKIVP